MQIKRNVTNICQNLKFVTINYIYEILTNPTDIWSGFTKTNKQAKVRIREYFQSVTLHRGKQEDRREKH